MGDVLVPEVGLDTSSIVPLIREVKTCRVAQHVNVNGEAELGDFPGLSNYLAY